MFASATAIYRARTAAIGLSPAHRMWDDAARHGIEVPVARAVGPHVRLEVIYGVARVGHPHPEVFA